MSLQKAGILLICSGLTRVAHSLQKDIKVHRKQQLDVTTLTCGKGVTELQKLTNLRMLSFAESHQMQQKNVDVYPKGGEGWDKFYPEKKGEGWKKFKPC